MASESEPRFSWSMRRRVWLGVLPFYVFVAAFLIYPSLSLGLGAFQDEAGRISLRSVKLLATAGTLQAYWTSIRLSAVSAFIGGLFGFFLARAALSPGMPRWSRTALTTASGVAANFAGVPLAFAFVATMGSAGIVTTFLRDTLGVDVQQAGFSLYSFWGLVVVYLYFQLPLMVLVISPALEALRTEWYEAATNLGASTSQYWRYVALPILLPSLLGAMVLLFGNAFGAYATAYALTSGQVPLVPVVIGQVKIGNVVSDPHFGDALALGMLIVMTAALIAYVSLYKRATRWQR